MPCNRATKTEEVFTTEIYCMATRGGGVVDS